MLVSDCDPQAIVEAHETARVLGEMLRTLTPREERVVRLYFWEGLTLREIGVELMVSMERIRQILHKALRKLRHPSRTTKLRGKAPLYTRPPLGPNRSRMPAKPRSHRAPDLAKALRDRLERQIRAAEHEMYLERLHECRRLEYQKAGLAWPPAY